MQFTSFAQIQQHEFVGNYYGDQDAFDAIEAFARDESKSVFERASALRVMYRTGMGLDGVDGGDLLSDADLLAEFIEFSQA